MKKNENPWGNDRGVAIHYLKTFSDTAREPFLILDSKLKIIGANESFYKNFKVSKEETDNKYIYDVGDGQWDTPELKKLLEEILPKQTVFNNFEVSYKFPKIGQKNNDAQRSTIRRNRTNFVGD